LRVSVLLLLGFSLLLQIVLLQDDFFGELHAILDGCELLQGVVQDAGVLSDVLGDLVLQLR